jgi:hypothetical protein
MKMTVRGLMIAVAMISLVLGVGLLKKRRDERLQRLAFYSGLEHKFLARPQAIAPGKPSHQDRERLNFFRAMRRKWEWTASHPWESVEPDPP